MTEKSEELTPEQALTIRRAARIMDERGEHAIARGLKGVADDEGAPDLCEGCPEPATTSDVDGVPLCAKCAESLDREQSISIPRPPDTRQSKEAPELIVSDDGEPSLGWGVWEITAAIEAKLWHGVGTCYSLTVTLSGVNNSGEGVCGTLSTDPTCLNPEEAAERFCASIGSTILLISEHEEDGDEDRFRYHQLIDLRPLIDRTIADWRANEKASAS